MEDALHRRSADLALGHRTVGHLLHHVEVMPVVTAVLVNRHLRRPSIGQSRPPRPGLDSRPMPAATMDEVVALCKRRGLIFPASEIYGGIANTYDYGHYGVLLKRNVTDAWWQAMIQERDDVVALDSAIIQHPRTWEASGHLAGFSDPLVQCLGKCKRRFRLDHLQEAAEAAGEDPAA